MTEFDVVVVGAGPAGMSAALAAEHRRVSVLLLDDNPKVGGQIWRAYVGHKPYHAAARMFRHLRHSLVKTWQGASVVDVPTPGQLSVHHAGSVKAVNYKSLVLATGARELFLPFPGWTLPNVMGAGGAQALLKGGAHMDGRRVVVSGSGPLLLAVGAAFADADAELIGVYEQTPFARLLRFGLRAMNPAKGLEAVRYVSALGSAPYRTGTWVKEARGEGRVEEVVLTDGRWTWTEPCDLLACAYGLVPNTELGRLLGCEVDGDSLRITETQETSVKGVYAAGEICGVGGLDLAIAEGELAGSAAAGSPSAHALHHVKRWRPFRASLAEAFQVRPEVKSLANADTLLCRCEDVPLGAVSPTWTAREAKLYTRLGMGPCQGRVCGAAARCLFGWDFDRPRPPLYPVSTQQLAQQEE